MMNQKLRGIIHNHSACSKEGCYPLSELRERWAPHLDFAAMTEHAERTTAEAFAGYLRECDALSDDRFRFIPGLEVSTDSGDMLLLGCRKFICTRDPFQVLREAQGCVILLAHPEDGHVMPAVLEQAHGMEGWNSGHMGGYMPPIDWFKGWRRQLPPGKILTGGNDIHKIDPKRKILTIVESPSRSDADILAAIGQGHFIISNGIFSFTPSGHVFHHRGSQQEARVTGQLHFVMLSRFYRLGWRNVNVCLELGAKMLTRLGLGKQQRTQLNRMIRQYL